MNITIFGSGYVGLVTGACLAEVGNQILLNPQLHSSHSPIVMKPSRRRRIERRR